MNNCFGRRKKMRVRNAGKEILNRKNKAYGRLKCKWKSNRSFKKFVLVKNNNKKSIDKTSELPGSDLITAIWLNVPRSESPWIWTLLWQLHQKTHLFFTCLWMQNMPWSQPARQVHLLLLKQSQDEGWAVAGWHRDSCLKMVVGGAWTYNTAAITVKSTIRRWKGLKD